MAIGNVNTYATVEGTPTDFGKMTTEAIDKYNAEEDKRASAKAAKEAAVAKDKAERVKETKFELKSIVGTSSKSLQDAAFNYVNSKGDEIKELIDKKINGEISDGEFAKRKAEYTNSIDQLNSYNTTFNEHFKKVTDNPDKYNTLYLKSGIDEATKKGQGKFAISFENGEAKYHSVNQDENGVITSVSPDGISGTDFNNRFVNMPTKYDFDKDDKNTFLATAKQGEIDSVSGNFILTNKVRPTEGTPLYTAIDAKAWNVTSNPNAAKSIWAEILTSKKIDPSTDLRWDGKFTDAETKEIHDKVKNDILNVYPESLEKKKMPLGTGGGGANKKVETPKPQGVTLYTPGKYATEEDKPVNKDGVHFTIPNQMHGFPITKPFTSTKEDINPSNSVFYYDKNTGKMYMKTIQSKGESVSVNQDLGNKARKTVGATTKSQDITWSRAYGDTSDFLNASESYIGTPYKGLDGKPKTIQSGSVEEMKYFGESMLKNKGIKAIPKAETKTYSDIQEKAIAKGMKDNPGYTREETISNLKIK